MSVPATTMAWVALLLGMGLHDLSIWYLVCLPLCCTLKVLPSKQNSCRRQSSSDTGLHERLAQQAVSS